jgi:hypothetical protein
VVVLAENRIMRDDPDDELEGFPDVAGFEGSKSTVRRAWGRFWRAAAGDELGKMLVTPEQTEAYFQNPSFKLRLVAISILRVVWKPNARLAAICEKMAFEDPHEQVRGVALNTLVSCYKGTDDPRIGNLLAQIVDDETKSLSFRGCAYDGLFKLRFGFVSVRNAPLPYRFPEHIDWEFVRSFAARNQGLVYSSCGEALIALV